MDVDQPNGKGKIFVSTAKIKTISQLKFAYKNKKRDLILGGMDTSLS